MASGGHHGYSFMPAGMYRHLVKIAGDNKLSIKELEIMFVRDWCYRTGLNVNIQMIGLQSPKLIKNHIVKNVGVD